MEILLNNEEVKEYQAYKKLGDIETLTLMKESFDFEIEEQVTQKIKQNLWRWRLTTGGIFSMITFTIGLLIGGAM